MRLYSTLQRELVELPPAPSTIGMYVCGPTVYQRAHIGNARPFVLFSWIRNWLRLSQYDVTYVHNITDINDSIYEAAPGASAELAARATAWYLEDIRDLGLGMPDHVPKASETIDEIITMIERLIRTDYAYAVAGDVYFRVARHREYGQLSNQRPDEMEEQEPNPLKVDPRDFALWKANKPGEDTWWDSPWGRGRPGWHIECSAMAEELLGLDFEIHGGGSDLVFPHHENEIAQTEAARGAPLARVWMHNGIVRLDQEKMSKSVGNIRLLGEALERFGRDALVTYLGSGHYRRPLAFSQELLREAGRAVDRVRDFCLRLDPGAPEPEALGAYAERFFAALADDFNTPAARAALFDWVAEGNRRLDARETLGVGELEAMLRCLGLEHLLGQTTYNDTPTGTISLSGTLSEPDERVGALLAEREAARAARDFATADLRRDEIAALGWDVRDTPQGAQLVPRR